MVEELAQRSPDSTAYVGKKLPSPLPPTDRATQKGAGMLWGANASRKRANRDPGTDDFGDFGNYMAEKQRKLRLQFQADASDKDISDMVALNLHTDAFSLGLLDNMPRKLFEGISIFVDGFTIPSHQELRMLMIKYGGSFENYFRRDCVTHIICNTLPDSKIKDFRSFSRGLPVVKPSWVVDSIISSKVLPLSPYYLERVAREDPNQCTISRFLGSNGDNNAMRSCKTNTHTLPDMEKGSQQGQHNIQGLLFNTNESIDRCHAQMPCSSPLPISDQDNLQGTVDMLDENYGSAPSSSNDGLQAKGSSRPGQSLNPLAGVDNRKVGTASVHENVQSHCTLGDANFVQNYFKNSRLHFIGTWRTRYQSRFGCINTEKDSVSDDCPSLSSAEPSTRTTMHVDMDCFFVSVVVRDRPTLSGKPVAVCHSENAHGTAEISSSNYAARKFGVKSGMFIRDAKSLCPGLEIVPYDFEGYQQVADEFYDILHKHCKKVQAISCDEAYLDVSGVEDPKLLASSIRNDILQQTRCTASVGIAGNLLLARIATRKAKPDGLYQIFADQVEEFISDLPVEDLPGVGWSLQERLHDQAIYSCIQLRALSKDALQKEFGPKTGDMLWCYARGIDHRQVQNYQERKSIGAEVNWGVRFNSLADAQYFLSTLCEEVSERLQNATVCGRTFTLKIKRKKEGAGEPQKFMGCGSCDNLSKSVTLPSGTNAVDALFRVSKQILSSFHLDVNEIRGMGLQVTKLETITMTPGSRGQQQQKALDSWLHASEKEALAEEASPVKASSSSMNERVTNETHAIPWGINENQTRKEKGMQSLGKVLKGQQQQKALDSWLHASAKEALAEEASPVKASSFSMNERVTNETHAIPWGINKNQMRKEKGMQSLGKVLKGPFSARRPEHPDKDIVKQKAVGLQALPDISELDQSVLACLPPDILAEINDAYSGAVAQHMSSGISSQESGDGKSSSKFQTSEPYLNATVGNNSVVCERTGRVNITPTAGDVQACSSKDAVEFIQCSSKESMPLSLSQLDMATLEELPSQVRKDVLRFLPEHRPVNWKNGIETVVTDKKCLPEQPGPSGNNGNFEGIPGIGTSELLQFLSEYSLHCESTENLSLLLLESMHCIHKSPKTDETCQESISSPAFICSSEFLKQYLQLKASCNLEEVSTVVRVLKRLAGVSKFWAKIWDSIVPYAQAVSVEHYGGSLWVG